MTSLRHCGDHWSELQPLLKHDRATYFSLKLRSCLIFRQLSLCLISQRQRFWEMFLSHRDWHIKTHYLKKKKSSIKYFWPSVLLSRICTRSSVCNRKVENKTSTVAATSLLLVLPHQMIRLQSLTSVCQWLSNWSLHCSVYPGRVSVHCVQLPSLLSRLLRGANDICSGW